MRFPFEIDPLKDTMLESTEPETPCAKVVNRDIVCSLINRFLPVAYTIIVQEKADQFFRHILYIVEVKVNDSKTMSEWNS